MSSNAPDSVAALYQARQAHFAGERSALESRARQISTGRFALFASMIVVVGMIVWRHAPSWTWSLFGLALFGFVGLMFVHALVFQRLADARRGELLYVHGLLRVGGKFREIPYEATPAPAGHPFADDLDVLGKGSLLARLDRTSTLGGRAELASLLVRAEAPCDAQELEHTLARQAAVRELAALHPLRERLATELQAQLDPKPLLTILKDSFSVPAAALWRLLAFALPLATLACWLWAPRYWYAPVAVSFVLSLWIGARLAPLFDASKHLPALVRTHKLLGALAEHPFEAPLLARLREDLAAAARVLTRFSRITSFVSARENEVFRLFIGPLFAWDIHCGLLLLSVQREGATALTRGFDALAELEALASLAWFAAEEPGISFPTLSVDAGFEASELAHPLLAQHVRTPNDVCIGARGELLLVTGSNMSGKSTLLRSMGLAVVLARAGAPVCAKQLRLAPAHLAVSLRVRDDVGEGVSRFYAELRKLKVILDAARKASAGAPSCFLVDEILSGTNSRERAIGARSLLMALIESGAFGAASTHDLELHALAEHPKVEICHFEEQVENGKLAFDHKLRPGPVVSSNALRLMHEIGLDVVDPA